MHKQEFHGYGRQIKRLLHWADQKLALECLVDDRRISRHVRSAVTGTSPPIESAAIFNAIVAPPGVALRAEL